MTPEQRREIELFIRLSHPDPFVDFEGYIRSLPQSALDLIHSPILRDDYETTVRSIVIQYDMFEQVRQPFIQITLNHIINLEFMKYE